MKYKKIAKQFEIIDKKRNELGIIIPDLCKSVGITPQAYNNAKNGDANIGTNTTFNICLALGINYIDIKTIEL
jgi:DNA-binding XRE family transcriptional regulator